MEEEIRIIDGTNGMYGVSNMGNIYSFFNGTKRKLACSVNRYNGYRAFTMIMPDGSRKTKTVHRLVAQEFLPNPNNFKCVNHKNEDKTDNRADNLEWCTYKYNSNYGTIKSRMREKQIGKRNSYYRLVCPLVIYTMKCIQHKTNKEILTELGIGSACLYRKLREYKICEITKYKRKAEH